MLIRHCYERSKSDTEDWYTGRMTNSITAPPLQERRRAAIKRLALLLGFALFLLMPTSVTATECRFVLGFKTLRDLIGHEIVGECLENERYAANGNSEQETTGGLLVWRKADNVTAFTDGYRTWLNGPNGLVQRLNTERFAWEADYAPGGGIATPTPTPSPTPSPESLIRVEQAIAAVPDIQERPLLASELRRLAAVSQPVFWSYLNRAGDSRLEANPLRHTSNIAQIDELTALQIVQMPFMSTPDQGADYAVLEHASRLARSDLTSLKQVLSHPKLHGGIADDHITTFVLLVLELSRPDATAAIQALPWIQDGVSRHPFNNITSIRADPERWEEHTVLVLVRMASKSQEVVMALARKPWLQDGLVGWEHQVIFNLSDITDGDAESALQLVGMPFLEKSATADDAGILDALDGVLWYSPKKEKGLRELLAHPALRGGITDKQRATVELLAVSMRTPAITAAIDTLPWVRDGIDASEERAVSMLHEASRGTRELLPALTQKSWARDSLTMDELEMIQILTGISRNFPHPDELAALTILEMPFLADEDFDAADSAAMRSLSGLHSEFGGNYLRQVLSHPTLSGGIADANRSRVSVLASVVSERPHLLDVLLDPIQTSVEERAIVLPRAGEMLLAVVHTRPGKFRTMDILEDTVRAQEEFMLVAFPRKFVGLLVADANPAGGTGGQMGIPTIDPGMEENIAIIAHEVAHTYWSFSASWISEGGAEVLRAVTEGASINVRHAQLSLCHLADSLSEIERIEFEAIRSGKAKPYSYLTGNCPYVLGLGLFSDLYERLGDGAFRQGFRNLYIKLKNDEHEDVCYGVGRSVCYVKAAFVTDASPAAAAIAEPIINRWYYGLESGAQ